MIVSKNCRRSNDTQMVPYERGVTSRCKNIDFGRGWRFYISIENAHLKWECTCCTRLYTVVLSGDWTVK